MNLTLSMILNSG